MKIYEGREVLCSHRGYNSYLSCSHFSHHSECSSGRLRPGHTAPSWPHNTLPAFLHQRTIGILARRQKRYRNNNPPSSPIHSIQFYLILRIFRPGPAGPAATQGIQIANLGHIFFPRLHSEGCGHSAYLAVLGIAVRQPATQDPPDSISPEVPNDALFPDRCRCKTVQQIRSGPPPARISVNSVSEWRPLR